MPTAASTAPASPAARARAWLAASANPDGSWGYLPGRPGRPEPTLLAAASGLPAPLAWLEAHALDAWPVLLLPVALTRHPEAAALRTRAVERVLALHGEPVSETPGGYDGSLVGWSWVPGTFSWVEPTAWGLLSLRAAGLGDHPRAREAIRLLRDRQCADGGWNAGAPEVLGTDLPGYAYLTGWVVLALPPGDPAAERGLRFLEAVESDASVRALALAVLARLAHGRPPGAALARLRARQRPDDGGFGARVDDAALAACALGAAEGGGPAFLPPAEVAGG